MAKKKTNVIPLSGYITTNDQIEINKEIKKKTDFFKWLIDNGIIKTFSVTNTTDTNITDGNDFYVVTSCIWGYSNNAGGFQDAKLMAYDIALNSLIQIGISANQINNSYPIPIKISEKTRIYITRTATIPGGSVVECYGFITGFLIPRNIRFPDDLYF